MMNNEEYDTTEETVGAPAEETGEKKEQDKQSLREHVTGWYSSNSGMFWGMLIGLIIAVLFLTIGFFQTLLIIILIALGGFLGSRPDVRASISQFFSNIFTNKPKDTT